MMKMNDDDLRWLYPDRIDDTKVLPQVADSSARAQGYVCDEPFPMANQTSPDPALQQPKRRRRRPLVKAVALLLVLWLVYLVAVPIIGYFAIRTHQGYTSQLADQPGTAILLVGSDAREDMTIEQRKRLKTGDTAGRRTDSILLLYTAPSGKALLLSFPRDSYLNIPGKGKDKLNAAYAYGGSALLRRTIEERTGIKIDGYVEIGMLGLVDLVDAVGGIEVCPPKAIKDRDSHLNIPQGCQTLDGVKALGYARMRKADPTGDLGRMKRQREIIGKIVRRGISPMTFLNPVRYWNVIMAGSQAVYLSQDTSTGEFIGLARGMLGTGDGSTISMTVPIQKANAVSPSGASIVVWNNKKADSLFQAIREGDLSKVE